MRRIRWAIAGSALLLSSATGAAPSVTLVAPATETRYVAPAAIALIANPSVDAGRSIARVEFLADGEIIGVATHAPYAFNWTNVARGNYALRARVFDSRGARDASPVVRVHVRNNTAPRVHLSAPEHRYIAPGSVPLSAQVTDRDDPIAKVEFFNGNTLLATTTAEPYTFNWTGVAAGNYEVRAKATDALGAVGTSNAFRVRVRDNVAPHVRILAPGNHATYAAPASIPVNLRSNDRDDNLASVELLANGVQLATFSAAPYDFNWTNVPPGTYALTARATDELGLTTTSRTVTVQVTGTQPNVPPTVSLTSPTNNASFTAPAAIPLTAAATDSDGTISKVEFFYGTTLIATRTQAPYSITWTGVPEGTYALTALVTDNLGASTSSSIVNITVTRAELKMYFIHVDHLNTPRLVADELQRTVWRWDQQEPFGNNVPDENPSGLVAFDLPLRLPGQYFDKETNVHYNYFRDYDPETARYVQSDPVGLEGGLNTYAYVRSHPLTYFDPDGLEVRFVCRALAGYASYTGKQHCFVFVTCPQEGWATTLSLFGQAGLWPDHAYKAANEGPDNPNGPNKFNQPVAPPNQCFGDPCAYEKAIIRRFNSFPGGFVPYSPTGPNSNSFARELVTGNQYGGVLPAGAPGPNVAPGINMPHPSFPR
jgi:RHS repeat-associated protein